MSQELITVGTDGHTNWVSTVDGRRYNLGVMSVLDLVTRVLPPKMAMKVLDVFLDKGAVMFRADSVKLSKAFGRVASKASMKASLTETMTTSSILNDIKAVERHIKALDEASSKKAHNIHDGLDHLVKLAAKLADHGLPESSLPQGPYSFQAFEANSKLVSDIGGKAAKVVSRIDALVAEGKKFNASKAKNDVREVTVRVASVMRDDITHPESSRKLTVLAKEMDRLHGLFYPTK